MLKFSSKHLALSLLLSTNIHSTQTHTPEQKLTEQPTAHTEKLTAAYWYERKKTSPFFDGKKLADAPAMRKLLVEQEGFEEVSFKSTDGHKLAGLLRRNPNAAYTVVSFCGFIPGQKEGMATLVEFFDKNVNILLVEARGHGQSEGPFMSTLGEYGLDEHNDVTGALAYTHAVTQAKPIIVHGLCMGGRHATVGLAQLSTTTHANSKLPLIAHYNIRGFISDSAPTCAKSVTPILRLEVTGKMLPQLFKKLPGYRGMAKQDIVKTRLFKTARWIVGKMVDKTRYVLMDARGLNFNEKTGAILSKGKARLILCPQQFIHPTCDSYIPSCDTQELAKEVANKREWYPADQVEHVKMHIDHPERYYKTIHEFIDWALVQPLPTQPAQAPLKPYDFRQYQADLYQRLKKAHTQSTCA